MTPSRHIRHWLTRLGLLSGAALVLTGCPENGAEITESASEPSQNFPISSNYVEPVGAFNVDRIGLISFDTTISDALGTSIAGTDQAYSSTARGDAANGTDFGPGWNFGGYDRNSSTDPRLPALTDADASMAADDGFVIGDPAEVGGADLHNPFTEGLISGLDPNAEYIVAFFRYELQVNGELDAALAAQGLPLDVADALVVAGGTGPAGDPTTTIEAFPTIVPFAANANPFIAGRFTTDANGDGAFDVVFDGTGGLLFSTASGDPTDADFDISLVSRNDDTATMLPRYNYVVILEGPATDAADAADNPPAMRIQIGQDFLSGGGIPINNGYAPFPLQFSTADLVGAPGGAGGPDSLTATYNSLKQLAGGAAYEMWLVNPETGSMIPAVGTYNKFQIVLEVDPVTGEILSSTDSLVETVTGTASFAGDARTDPADGLGGFRHQMVIGDASLNAGDRVGFHTYALLTTTASPGGASPAASRPFWFQYTDQNGTPDDFGDDSFILSGATSFGNFDAADPDASRTYSGEGQGNGGVREGILSADLTALSRPPVGYVLTGWVMGIPATFAPVQSDTITGGSPDFISIFDADVEMVEGVVTPNGILTANFRLDGSMAAVDYTKFGFFQVALEPKLGIASMGPIPVQVGELPERIVNPPDTTGTQ